jgi:hypothetical protein
MAVFRRVSVAGVVAAQRSAVEFSQLFPAAGVELSLMQKRIWPANLYR